MASRGNQLSELQDGSAALDALSAQTLMQRQQNRMMLLERLAAVRSQIQALEKETADIERIVMGLPYGVQQRAAGNQPAEGGPRRFSLLANAAAGGMALPLAVGCMHPLDTVRTTMQAALHSQTGFYKSVKSLGVRGAFRGFGLSAFWACPQGAIRLSCYGSCKDKLADAFDYTPLSIVVSAIVGDMASSIVKVPRELITQRMQAGQYLSTSVAVRQILAEDGLAGLFRGYLSTSLRDAPFMVLLFISYEQFKTWKVRLTFAHDEPGRVLSPWSDAETVLWGGISGFIAGFLTTPFDVVKTRIMTSRQQMTVADAMRSIGVAGLCAGAVPRSCWWFCVCSIFFCSFERLRVTVQDHVDAVLS